MIDALIQKIVGAFSGMSPEELVMVTIGLVGQLLFTMRFLVQWLTSEISRKSVIPIAFWYFSIAGGATLFVYALWRQDPVFILGQGTGLFIYSRNLWLIHRERRETEAAARQASS